MSTNHDDTLSPGWPYHVPSDLTRPITDMSVGSVVFEPAPAGVPLKMPNFVSTIGGRREENDVTFSGPTPEQIAEARKAEADARLRDHFAGQALPQAMAWAKQVCETYPNITLASLTVEIAYDIADAMMRERAERAKRSEAKA